jgi:hypothetical protein
MLGPGGGCSFKAAGSFQNNGKNHARKNQSDDDFNKALPRFRSKFWNHMTMHMTMSPTGEGRY